MYQEELDTIFNSYTKQNKNVNCKQYYIKYIIRLI